VTASVMLSPVSRTRRRAKVSASAVLMLSATADPF
jgi:hypothetical protein